MNVFIKLTTAATALLCAPLMAQAESWDDGGYDALYRPDTFYTDHYECTANAVGDHTGSTRITETMIEGYFLNCELSQPRAVTGSNATQYYAMCNQFDKETTLDLTITRTDRGVDIKRGDYTEEWLLCDQAIEESENWVSREEAEIGDWKLYYIESFVEMETYNDQGDLVNFGCRWNWKEGRIFIQIDGSTASGPKVIFDIDGNQYPMTTEGGIFGQINTGCEDCKDKYRELWRAVTLGNHMTVIPSEGRSAEFSLEGSHAIMGDIPCIPVKDPSATPH